jgi:hypothetical protein
MSLPLQHPAGFIDKFVRNRLQRYFRPVVGHGNPSARLNPECRTHVGRDYELTLCAYRGDLTIHAYIVAQCKRGFAQNFPLDKILP